MREAHRRRAPSGPRPNYGLKLTSRLAALARVHLGSYAVTQKGQRGQSAGSQLKPVRQAVSLFRGTPVLRWAKHVVVVGVLALSVYVGFGNTDDITNTITVWQRLVGAAATAYALLALAALVGYWRRARWLDIVLWTWAGLVVFTSALAALVYGATGGSSILVVAASVVLPALVLWAARGQHNRPPTPRAAA